MKPQAKSKHLFSCSVATIMKAQAICPLCYCCASRNHSHDKGMWPSCKHIFNPPRPPAPRSSLMYLSISPSWSVHYYPDLVCSERILLWFPRRAQKRPCFSPKAHFQESACVKLQCSRRCPTFKLHSSPWDCFWPLTKGESLCAGQQGCVHMCI